MLVTITEIVLTENRIPGDDLLNYTGIVFRGFKRVFIGSSDWNVSVMDINVTPMNHANVI